MSWTSAAIVIVPMDCREVGRLEGELWIGYFIDVREEAQKAMPTALVL